MPSSIAESLGNLFICIVINFETGFLSGYSYTYNKGIPFSLYSCQNLTPFFPKISILIRMRWNFRVILIFIFFNSLGYRTLKKVSAGYSCFSCENFLSRSMDPLIEGFFPNV